MSWYKAYLVFYILGYRTLFGKLCKKNELSPKNNIILKNIQKINY